MNNHPVSPSNLENPLSKKPRGSLRLKVIFLGLAILLCGVMIGAGGMLFWGRELILKRLQHVRPRPEMICERLGKTLNLNPDQKTEVARILNDYFPRIRAIRQSKDQLTHEEFRAMHREIFAILDPRQAELYEQELGKMLPRHWHRRGFHRGGAPPDR
ncbi:MAG: hypothetical protein GX751_06215 [Desulfuromonadaceae bacterium]|nr:hypothetical protein [Desulfuromonadaceae bacterium]